MRLTSSRCAVALLSLFVALACASPAAALICGDGLPDPGELCDDANLIDGDGCDSNCTPTGCGNGVVTAGETCDGDSNCSATCALLCPVVPSAACGAPIAPHLALLVARGASDDGSSRIAWQWNGEAPKADF